MKFQSNTHEFQEGPIKKHNSNYDRKALLSEGEDNEIFFGEMGFIIDHT